MEGDSTKVIIQACSDAELDSVSELLQAAGRPTASRRSTLRTRWEKGRERGDRLFLGTVASGCSPSLEVEGRKNGAYIDPDPPKQALLMSLNVRIVSYRDASLGRKLYVGVTRRTTASGLQ